MKEAIERTFEPPEVHHERLFVISVLGFIVNLVGIFVFQHGGQHNHSHGGCSHSHSHSHSQAKQHQHLHHHHNLDHNHDTNHNNHNYSHYSSPTTIYQNQEQHQQLSPAGIVTLDMNGYSTTSSKNQDSSYHEHNHSHLSEPLIEPAVSISRPKSSGRGQIMQSVFLHIVADTLGSIGVMISAVLMNQFGWMIADPLCSLFIAILISISVYPLLRDSINVLMQRVPVEIEDKIPDIMYKIKCLNGVVDIHEKHFWTLNSDTYIGCLKIMVSPGIDYKHLQTNARNLLTHIGVEKVHIQIDQTQ